MIGVFMEVHHGKLYVVHPAGYYISFTWEEWQAAKEAGDELFRKRTRDEVADADR